MAVTTTIGYQRYPSVPDPIHVGPMRVVYHVSIKRDEGDWFVARCVEIPAAVTQGKSKDEALLRSIEAIGSILDVSGGSESEFVVLPTEG